MPRMNCTVYIVYIVYVNLFCIIDYINKTHLADGEAKDLFKISWLTNEQEVEGPATTEVCHNNGIDRHRCEEFTPRSFEFLLRNIECINV